MAKYSLNTQGITGRKEELEALQDIFDSEEAELIAVYGRRRVGKTFLIRNAYREQLAFEFSGVHNATLEEQLKAFTSALTEVLKLKVPVPHSWFEAFDLLRDFLQPKLKRRQVVFFDEFPWLQTPRSRFMQAFEFFWNSWASRQPNLIVVICGSAASWMIQRVIHNRGGLYNRVTRRMRLLPFSLGETESFLQAKKIHLDRYQVLQIFMAMGGIPHYLKEIKVGESATQAIDRICFTKDGLLYSEFKDLYNSLFEKAENHTEIIRALAKKSGGLTRNEIIEACHLTTGGGVTQILDELIESGFINSFIPFGKTTRDTVYQLTDAYSHFYIKFIEPSRSLGAGTWKRLSRETSWKSWAGYAFEGVCLKHIEKIKKAIGIEDVYTEHSTWRLKSQKDTSGAQIDLLIDRQDNCINVCEMKFSLTEFTIDKLYASELRQKLQLFQEASKTRKTLFLTMITTYGVKKNDYYVQLVQKQITMDALF
jgi:hypothetical protein